MDNQIDELYQVLVDRKENPTADSYTSQLLANEEEIAKKIGEETADLIYHTLVLLVANDLTWEDVLAELALRRR